MTLLSVDSYNRFPGCHPAQKVELSGREHRSRTHSGPTILVIDLNLCRKWFLEVQL